MRKKIKKSENLSEWYLEIIKEAKLADYGPVKGTIVFRPNGYALWEKIQQEFDKRVKQMGARNTYYPLFIPMSFFEKEKEHVKGFNPELAIVTHGGGKKLEEPIAVRPTSETVMYAMFSKWIQSYRDLPLKHNQWCNVVRWELRTFPFLRTSEFLWQEGHTAHETAKEAKEQVSEALRNYQEFFSEALALPVVVGRKTKSEAFAGAEYTLSCEALMPDGKALQIATSHYLGQNFSSKSAFDISFQTRDKKTSYVFQTSWGLSTRAIGGLIMVHGDDNGLIVPPRLAFWQAVIIPIYKNGQEGIKVLSEAENMSKLLGKAGLEVLVDKRDKVSVGFKFNDWEVKGVPVRLEIGPKDMKKKSVILVRRDTGEKLPVKISDLPKRLPKILSDIQQNLYQRAEDYLNSHIVGVGSMDEFKQAINAKKGFIRAGWCGSEKCEAEIKSKTKATARVIPFDRPEKLGKCIVCSQKAKYQPFWARAY